MAEGVISRTPLCGIWWEGHLFLQRRPHLVTGRIRQAMWLSGFKMVEWVWTGENEMDKGKKKNKKKNLANCCARSCMAGAQARGWAGWKRAFGIMSPAFSMAASERRVSTWPAYARPTLATPDPMLPKKFADSGKENTTGITCESWLSRGCI